MQLAIGLFPKFTALDAIGPYQVLSPIPDIDVTICAAERGRVTDDNGLLHIDVEHTFDDIPRPDVLVIPGGTVTREIARPGEPIVEWIRSAHEHTTWTASVCTGALLLGVAGVLDGLDATTHWAAYDDLASTGARPTDTRVVRSGKVLTGAGVSAGIDMALTLLIETHGTDMAEAIQLGIEYDPDPPVDAGSTTKARPEIVELVRGSLESSL